MTSRRWRHSASLSVCPLTLPFRTTFSHQLYPIKISSTEVIFWLFFSLVWKWRSGRPFKLYDESCATVAPPQPNPEKGSSRTAARTSAQVQSCFEPSMYGIAILRSDLDDERLHATFNNPRVWIEINVYVCIALYTRRWVGGCVLQFYHHFFSIYMYVRTSFSGPRKCVWVFPLSSFDARGPESLFICLSRHVYTHLRGPIPCFWRYPFLGVRLEKWVVRCECLRFEN